MGLCGNLASSSYTCTDARFFLQGVHTSIIWDGPKFNPVYVRIKSTTPCNLPKSLRNSAIFFIPSETISMNCLFSQSCWICFCTAELILSSFIVLEFRTASFQFWCKREGQTSSSMSVKLVSGYWHAHAKFQVQTARAWIWRQCRFHQANQPMTDLTWGTLWR